MCNPADGIYHMRLRQLVRLFVIHIELKAVQRLPLRSAGGVLWGDIVGLIQRRIMERISLLDVSRFESFLEPVYALR